MERKLKTSRGRRKGNSALVVVLMLMLLTGFTIQYFSEMTHHDRKSLKRDVATSVGKGANGAGVELVNLLVGKGLIAGATEPVTQMVYWCNNNCGGKGCVPADCSNPNHDQPLTATGWKFEPGHDESAKQAKTAKLTMQYCDPRNMTIGDLLDSFSPTPKAPASGCATPLTQTVFFEHSKSGGFLELRTVVKVDVQPKHGP